MKGGVEAVSGPGYGTNALLAHQTSMHLSESRRPIYHKYSTVCYDSPGFNNRMINNNNKNNNNNNNNNWKYNFTSRMLGMDSRKNNNYGNITKQQLNKPLGAEHALNMCKLMRNYKESGRSTLNTSNCNIAKINLERRLSTGTLNRLILVAQALESEVQYHRQIDINGRRIVIALRTINLLILFAIDGLILSGVGQYYSNLGGKRSLMLTPDKWYYNIYSKLPITFGEMRLNGQYFATAITTIILIITILSHIIQLYWHKYSRLLCMCYSFCSVPFILFVFGLEIYYSTCPWINDHFRIDILRRDYNSMELYFDMQCGISGWALAGILSLLSCSLFISEGLVSAFFRSNSARKHNKMDIFL